MNNKVQNILLAVLAIGLIGLTVAYAALSQTLKITGTAKVASQTWSVHFDNLKQSTKTGYATYDGATLVTDSALTTISGIAGTLKTPGDSITYTFDIVNDGTIDANLESIVNYPSTLTCESDDSENATAVCKDLSYTITYSDGTAIAANDVLKSGDTKSAKLIVTYASDSTTLATKDITVSGINATYNYVQTNSSN